MFTSTNDLARRVMKYIRQHGKDARPIQWKYDDPTIASALLNGQAVLRKFVQR